MKEKSSPSGEPQARPDPVLAHELMFGREFTSGYLLEHGERSDETLEACAETVMASRSPSSPPEQLKPSNSLRV